jgi:hypothetical protein
MTRFALSALPLAPSATFEQTSMIQNVRVVCDPYGRCWNTGPRYRVVRRYYDPGYAYGPAYGYYGGPAYGYGWGPRVGIGFGFGRYGW